MPSNESKSSRLLGHLLPAVVLVALGYGLAYTLPLLRSGVEAPPPTPPPAAQALEAQSDGATRGPPTVVEVERLEEQVETARALRDRPVQVVPMKIAGGVDIPAVAEAVMPSVVSITTSTQSYYGRELSGGSGVILRDDGIIVTNNHVIEGAREAVAQLSDGREFPCRLVGRDAATDLAILQMVGVPVGELVPAVIGKSDNVRLGESVLAVGNPFGLSGTITMGIVSALGRGDVGIVDYEEFIQTDAAINPGNSGGALVNTKGELIGINTAILSRSGGSQGIGFAIPMHLVMPIAETLLAFGRVDRGWLGIYIAESNPYLARRLGLPEGEVGVVVRSLVRGGPAARAGLQPGDFIQRVQDQVVDTPAQLRKALTNSRAGDSVVVEFLREGEGAELELKLAPIPRERLPKTAQGGR